MAPTSIALKAAIGLLMVDSIIELGLVSSMVGWLHNTASGTFDINAEDGTTYALRGEPEHLWVDQGHTSNGAAGTAFVIVGCGGFIALWLRGRQNYHNEWFSKAFYRLWLFLNIPALLLTLGALAYVFAVTSAHSHHMIEMDVAMTLNGAKYPLNIWAPQNWFMAVLELDVADPGVRSDIAYHLRLMQGWQYNLIPMFIIQLFQTALAFVEGRRLHREVKYSGVSHEQKA